MKVVAQVIKNNQKMTPDKEYSLLVEEVEEEEENSYVTSVDIFDINPLSVQRIRKHAK
jgi:hypothetical protein